MTNKSGPKSVYSVRLDLTTVKALQLSADTQRITFAAAIRRAIDDYLDERGGETYLEQMEARLAGSIQRLSKHQYLTRRAVDLTIAELEYQRRLFALSHAKRLEGEDTAALLARSRNEFEQWLGKSMAQNGLIRSLIRQMIDPDHTFTEPEQENEDHAENIHTEGGANA